MVAMPVHNVAMVILITCVCVKYLGYSNQNYGWIGTLDRYAHSLLPYSDYFGIKSSQNYYTRSRNKYDDL